jgi:hypothetical protein
MNSLAKDKYFISSGLNYSLMSKNHGKSYIKYCNYWDDIIDTNKIRSDNHEILIASRF